MSKIFTPHELKTIEVDTEKKIFRINGEDFGDGCTGFSIHCKYEGFKVRVEIDTTVTYVTYDKDGKKQTEETYKTNDPWFTDQGSQKNYTNNDTKSNKCDNSLKNSFD